MLYSDVLVHIMGNVPYVGFATYRRATVKIRLYFKELMFMKKKRGRHIYDVVKFN